MIKGNFFKSAGKYFTLVCVLVLGWQLLAGSAAVANGVRQSLAICGNVLIPSLFPFMVLAAFLPATAAGRMAAGPLVPVGRLLYGLSPQGAAATAPALLMSWIGGYPAGARTLSSLVAQGRLSPENAGRALCFCVNGGPAFVVTVVGAGIFGSTRVGLILFGCQLAAGMVTARIMLGRDGVGSLPTGVRGGKGDAPISSALVSSVSSAASGMISICAFVLICGGLASLLGSTGITSSASEAISQITGGGISHGAALTFINGAMEICMGCAGAGQLSPMEALSVLPFLLSFSGVSCIFQLWAISGEQGIPMGRFILSRPLHGIITQIFAYLLLKDSCAAMPTGLITSPTLVQEPQSIVGTLLLLAMCAILFLTLEAER